MGILLLILVIAVIYIIAKHKGGSEPADIDTWKDSSARRAAARNAAAEMASHQVSRVENEAVRIRRVIVERKLNVNTQVLSDAVETSSRLIDHAERIRREVEQHRNSPQYLIQLYRQGVGISDRNYQLGVQLKQLKNQLYSLSRSNPSLKPLFEMVKQLANTVYTNQIELNNRNKVLKIYIGTNFSQREKDWYDNNEKRAQAKRSA